MCRKNYNIVALLSWKYHNITALVSRKHTCFFVAKITSYSHVGQQKNYFTKGGGGGSPHFMIFFSEKNLFNFSTLASPRWQNWQKWVYLCNECYQRFAWSWYLKHSWNLVLSNIQCLIEVLFNILVNIIKNIKYH